MKKILLLLLLIVPFVAHAQSYILTNKTVVDKFDDIISNREQKTIVTKTDSTFVIEEKGSHPVRYMIVSLLPDHSMGDKENVVNLVDNVYGYQECWAVILESEFENYLKEYNIYINEADKDKLQKNIDYLFNKYIYHITRRVVTTQYTHHILGQLIWIQKGENNGRTIYSKITN